MFILEMVKFYQFCCMTTTDYMSKGSTLRSDLNLFKLLLLFIRFTAQWGPGPGPRFEPATGDLEAGTLTFPPFFTKFFNLDPDPRWEKQLDLDPQNTNADPPPWVKGDQINSWAEHGPVLVSSAGGRYLLPGGAILLHEDPDIRQPYSSPTQSNYQLSGSN